jgi:hypothetical protein
VQGSRDRTNSNAQQQTTVICAGKQLDDSEHSDKQKYSSDHDSIIYTRDAGKNSIISNVLNTIESCTSSEFRAGLNIMDESSFISRGNHDVENLNIDIKDSGV